MSITVTEIDFIDNEFYLINLMFTNRAGDTFRTSFTRTSSDQDWDFTDDSSELDELAERFEMNELEFSDKITLILNAVIATHELCNKN